MRKSTKCDHLYAELGTIPLVYKRYIRLVNYWAKLKSSTAGRLSNQVFDVIGQRFGVSWCRGVRKVLRRYDMLHHWGDGLDCELGAYQTNFRNLV